MATIIQPSVVESPGDFTRYVTKETPEWSGAVLPLIRLPVLNTETTTQVAGSVLALTMTTAIPSSSPASAVNTSKGDNVFYVRIPQAAQGHVRRGLLVVLESDIASGAVGWACMQGIVYCQVASTATAVTSRTAGHPTYLVAGQSYLDVAALTAGTSVSTARAAVNAQASANSSVVMPGFIMEDASSINSGSAATPQLVRCWFDGTAAAAGRYTPGIAAFANTEANISAAMIAAGLMAAAAT